MRNLVLFTQLNDVTTVWAHNCELVRWRGEHAVRRIHGVGRCVATPAQGLGGQREVTGTRIEPACSAMLELSRATFENEPEQEQRGLENDEPTPAWCVAPLWVAEKK